MNLRLRYFAAWGAMCLSFLQLTPAACANQEAAANSLNVVVLEGQGTMHNIRLKSGRDIVVQVDNAAHQPIPGALVAFTLPGHGPSGTFANGEKSLVATTDAQGRAAARGLIPNKIAGKFEIRITASHQGAIASATVTQFNMEVQNVKSKGSSKWLVLLLAAGGAGAAGAVLATRGSTSAAPQQPPPAPASISISAGAGSVGPP
ncbi:MAG TPA: hypothetical protein VM120_22805 [Bryobacteraceae bacterium]|nr:hypothetical protein [Bryobacteraceae bacterium]